MDKTQALLMVKQRLNMMTGITQLDDYLEARIGAAEAELGRMGIWLGSGVDDLMLLVDYVVWQYQSRDKPGGRPEWLTMRLRDRWLHDRAATGEVAGDDP